MSEKKQGKLLQKEITRRKFLSIMGKGTVALSFSSGLLGLIGCTAQELESGVVTATVIGDKEPVAVLVHNRARCSGCQLCEINCTLMNDGKVQPHLSRVKVHDTFYFGEKADSENYAGGEGLFGSLQWTSRTCAQCADAACMKACPVGAIYADENTGIRMVNEEKCVGCGMCAQACPYNLPTIDADTHKSTKCVACGYCAKMCPNGALKIIPWSEFAKVL